MPRYLVTCSFNGCDTYEVEAQTEEEAISEAEHKCEYEYNYHITVVDTNIEKLNEEE